MTLLEVAACLETFDEGHTIYAKQPWTAESDAIVAEPPAKNALVSPELAMLGYSYFIEVSIALEFIQGWCSTMLNQPSSRQQCERLIQYAVNDA